MIVPATVGVIRTPFYHDDTHTQTHKVKTKPAVTVAACNHLKHCMYLLNILRLKAALTDYFYDLETAETICEHNTDILIGYLYAFT